MSKRVMLICLGLLLCVAQVGSWSQGVVQAIANQQQQRANRLASTPAGTGCNRAGGTSQQRARS
jgi:hypothetical protein